MLIDLRRRLHVQLTPDGLLGKGIHGIHRTILSKHLTIRIRHLFGIGRHELGVGSCDMGFGGLRRGKVCRAGMDGCSNALGDCQLFGRGLPTVVGEARSICAVTATSWAWAASTWSWAASIRAKATAAERTTIVPLSPVAIPEADVAAAT